MKDVLLVVLFLLVLGGAYLFYQYYTGVSPQLSAPPATVKPFTEETVPDEPGIRYPVPAVTEQPVQTMPEDVTSQPEVVSVDAPQPQPTVDMPALDSSDSIIHDALAGMFDAKSLRALLNWEGVIRRFVVTVDNLPRKSLPRKYLLPRATAGRFEVIGKDEQMYLDKANYKRYTGLLRLIEGVDLDRLVDFYIRYYVLFQEAYEDLGYPGRYFNDRLVSVIDHLLATPTVKAPIRLVRPRVMYKFADTDLEALSSGQKILLRTGPDNAARVKNRLRELRSRLVGQP